MFNTVKEGTRYLKRPGKEVNIGHTTKARGLEDPLRIVYKVTHRTIDANGQIIA